MDVRPQIASQLKTISGWLNRLAPEIPGHKRELKSLAKKVQQIQADAEGRSLPQKVKIYYQDDKIMVIPPPIGGSHHFKRAKALTFSLKSISGYKWEGKSAKKKTPERGACSFPKERAAEVKLLLASFFPGAKIVGLNGKNHGVLPNTSTS